MMSVSGGAWQADQPAKPFYFKQFALSQDRCAMKIGTDGVLLGAWADVSRAERILDIGTGSGVIAIMMGQRTPHARIRGVEIDRDSYEQALENGKGVPWADRLEFIHGSIQDYVRRAEEKFDLIVSNPPFFTGGTFSYSQERNKVRHTIKLSHTDLLSAARNLLVDTGKFAVVLPYIEGLRFRELARSYHLYCTRMTEVRPKVTKPVERLLMEFERREKSPLQDALVIQEEGINNWTREYVELTGAFYLKM